MSLGDTTSGQSMRFPTDDEVRAWHDANPQTYAGNPFPVPVSDAQGQNVRMGKTQSDRNTSEDDLAPAQALYAAEWEMRKAVGVCADLADNETHKAAARLLQRWGALRRSVRADEQEAAGG